LLVGFVAFPAEWNTIGEVELSALTKLKPDGVPALLLIGGPLIILPGGSVTVLLPVGGDKTPPLDCVKRGRQLLGGFVLSQLVQYVISIPSTESLNV
jgi:hypothetical protein